MVLCMLKEKGYTGGITIIEDFAKLWPYILLVIPFVQQILRYFISNTVTPATKAVGMPINIPFKASLI